MKTRPIPNAADVKQEIDYALSMLHRVQQVTGTITEISVLKYSDDDFINLPVLTTDAAEWIRFAISSDIVRMDRRVIPFAHYYAERQDRAFVAFAEKSANESDDYLTRFMTRLVARFGVEGARDWLLEDQEPATLEQNRIIVEYYNKAVKALNDAKP
jgi:hypothetical protein